LGRRPYARPHQAAPRQGRPAPLGVPGHYAFLKEILKAEAHISPWGKMTERYTKAANAFNADPTTRWNTDHKHAKDRVYLLKGGFEALDLRLRNGTGQEEVLNLMANLFVTTVQEQNGYQQKVADERNEKKAPPRRSSRSRARPCATWRWPAAGPAPCRT